jgi:hypothetical protein
MDGVAVAGGLIVIVQSVKDKIASVLQAQEKQTA